MNQNGPNDHFGQNRSELDFGIRETKMDQNGPFWLEEVRFGPFRSANRTLAIAEMRRTSASAERQHASEATVRKFYADLGALTLIVRRYLHGLQQPVPSKASLEQRRPDIENSRKTAEKDATEKQPENSRNTRKKNSWYLEEEKLGP